LNNLSISYSENVQNKSWTDYYNVLFIEQPVGVGFGNLNDIRDITQNETKVGAHFVQALTNFYGLSPFNDTISTPLYIFGESYAGHFIPSIASAILYHNANSTGLKFPLLGVGIGDGWTDPINQLSDFGLFGYAMGLIDDDERAQVESLQLDANFQMRRGMKLLNQDQPDYAGASVYMTAALADFDGVCGTIVTKGGNLNIYNFRDFGDYNQTALIGYLNSPQAQNKYCTRGSRFGNYTWDTVDQVTVYPNMSYYDFMNTVTPALIHTLENIPVMLYNGQDDIICNSPSTQNWISKLQWPGQQQFYDAEPQIWKLSNGTHAGWAKNYDKLTFVLVNKAGHMVPADQLDSSIDLVRRFIGNVGNWSDNTVFATDEAFKLKDEQVIIGHNF